MNNIPVILGPVLIVSLIHATAAPIFLHGPSGSGAFGAAVTALPNGNFVVTDPLFDAPGPVADVGAVYLYSPTLSLISRLTGSTQNDQVGSGGVTVLANGNFVVISPDWDASAGAATWGSATLGVNGVVSAANSLVGELPFDLVGSGGVTVLPSGNFVVRSVDWDTSKGAVTWGNGTSGLSGVVSASNSLVGETFLDQIGSRGITVLSNGNYVVSSPYWDSSSAADVGAITWGSGTAGVVGLASAGNSLVGSSPFDFVGGFGPQSVTALTNGNYVVLSPLWNNGAAEEAGAATWGNGLGGSTGSLSQANSFVGSVSFDQVGLDGVTALTNGNYVVLSKAWRSGAGAVSWGNGLIGSAGAVSGSNSLVGNGPNDRVGSDGVVALTNGNYVVNSSYWGGNGFSGYGAVTWGDGISGISGPVLNHNSLVGHQSFARIGSAGVIALTNGNYVVSSPGWRIYTNDFSSYTEGAITLGNGVTGVAGTLSQGNSLFGGPFSRFSPWFGSLAEGGSMALANGNYLVSSRAVVTFHSGEASTLGTTTENNSFVATAGKITPLNNGNYLITSSYQDPNSRVIFPAIAWARGTGPTTDSMSPSTALSGSKPEDQFGSGGITRLPNSDYVISSPKWGHVASTDEGAVTWGSGAKGIAGFVTPSNSLIGNSPQDQAGSGGVFPLPDNRYAVYSPLWDYGSRKDAGAVTLVDIREGTTGSISTRNSLLGTKANGGGAMPRSYDQVHRRLLVGYPADNFVGLLAFYPEIAVEQPAAQGIADGGSKDFGAVLTGSSRSLTFTIKNSALTDLTGLAITLNGPNPDQFSVVANPTAPVVGPNGSTSFTIRFAPTSVGAKTAAIHIDNNDQDESPFDITLTGQAVSTWNFGLWRSSRFTASELADPNISGGPADPDFDGWGNLLEYALFGDPKGQNGYPEAAYDTSTSGSRLKLVFDRDRAATDITLIVEAAESPAGPWETAATSTLGGSFLAEAAYVSSGHVVIGDKFSLNDPAHPRRFLRLTAVLLP